MKSAFFNFSLFFLCVVSYGQVSQEITGRVTQMGQPLANVNILIDGKGEGNYTNKSGFYKIEANQGNTLTFSYTGLSTVQIIVEDVTKILNISMESKVTALDEVTVTKKKLSPQQELAKDYPLNKKIIKTRFGFTDTRNSSWRVTIIDEDKTNISNSLDLASAIEGIFFGRIDRTDPSNPKFYDGKLATITEFTGDFFRKTEEGIEDLSQVDLGTGKEAMIFDVDGQVFENFPVHITTDDIDRIAIIPGQMAANIYSMRARGGVIVINTKGANVAYETGNDSDKVFDYERLRNNYFRDDTTSVRTNSNVPKYMLEMQRVTSITEALKVYNEQKSSYGTSPYFKMNVADYFLKSLGEQKIADEILDELASEYSKNAVVLKALAYVFDVRKEWAKSTDLYKKILRLRPKYAQSYRDLANGFVQSGDYGKALGMYVRYGKIKEGNSVSDQLLGIDATVESEYENISGLYGHEVFKDKSVKEPAVVWGARVLVEWNNSEADFELQVIHPNTQFFIVDHTISGNAKRIENEKKKGSSCEQIWFDYNDKGTWNINLKYLGNKSYDPTYFKITLYRDWGLPNQSQEIKVFRIDEKNRNRNVLRFNINGKSNP